MTAGFQDYFTGTVVGDHTGDGPKSIFDKQKTMLQELFGAATNSYAAVTLTAASTDNWAPWGVGVTPPQDWRLDVNLTTNDCDVTGLIAAFDGCRGTIRLTGSGSFNLTLKKANTSSLSANRFDGQGDAGGTDGAWINLKYYSLPSPRWAIG